MANVKRITLDYITALTVYAIIRREVDSYRLDDATGSFAAAPADPYVTLAEDSVIKGRYEKNESRAVWNDGRYTITIYQQTGGSPSPVADTIIGSGEMWIASDTEVAVDASISSRLATASYTAPDNAGITAIQAEVNTHPTLAEIEASTVLAKQAKLDFVEKWILNKLVENPAGTWTLYDDDSATPLKTWTWTAATSTRSKAT